MAEAELQPGMEAPDFGLEATRDGQIRLSELRGQIVVVYFYPRDNTPGCTREGQAFRDLYPDFRTAGAEVLGISRDSLKSHERFTTKHQFPFPLLADPDETVCRAYGTLKTKKIYGKSPLGVERSTFVIDAAGIIRHIHRNIKVQGHAEEVLAEIRQLESRSRGPS